MMKVLVLQVNHKNNNQNFRDLQDAIARGHTDADGWQMPGTAKPGDLVIWYETDGVGYVARGFVEDKPWRVTGPHGPFRGPVAAVQRIATVDPKPVAEACGIKGGHEGYQSVPDAKAVSFLRAVGLLE